MAEFLQPGRRQNKPQENVDTEGSREALNLKMERARKDLIIGKNKEKFVQFERRIAEWIKNYLERKIAEGVEFDNLEAISNDLRVLYNNSFKDAIIRFLTVGNENAYDEILELAGEDIEICSQLLSPILTQLLDEDYTKFEKSYSAFFIIAIYDYWVTEIQQLLKSFQQKVYSKFSMEFKVEWMSTESEKTQLIDKVNYALNISSLYQKTLGNRVTFNDLARAFTRVDWSPENKTNLDVEVLKRCVWEEYYSKENDFLKARNMYEFILSTPFEDDLKQWLVGSVVVLSILSIKLENFSAGVIALIAVIVFAYMCFRSVKQKIEFSKHIGNRFVDRVVSRYIQKKFIEIYPDKSKEFLGEMMGEIKLTLSKSMFDSNE